MRLLRRLVIMLIVLAGLAALGNVWVANAAEKKAAEQIQREFELDAPPTVQIDGFPILLRILQGKIPKVTVEGKGLDVQGLEVAHFRVQMDGIAASLGDLRGGVSKVRVGGGEAFAEVTQEATNAYLERQKEHRGRVIFREGSAEITKTVTYAGRRYDLRATGTLEIEGEDLVFTATNVTSEGKALPPGLEQQAKRDASFRVSLPALPGGIRAKRVVVREGVARLVAEFSSTTLNLTRA